MKKHFFSVLFVLLGSGLWVVLANTAQFSIKKWDAKFETVLRHSLEQSGLTTGDLISSVHEIRKDDGGEWVTHRIEIGLNDKKKMKKIRKQMESSGAKIVKKTDGDNLVYLVQRGSRTYQEIHFVPPLSQ